MPYFIFKQAALSLRTVRWDNRKQVLDAFLQAISLSHFIPISSLGIEEVGPRRGAGFCVGDVTDLEYVRQYCGFTKGISKTLIVASTTKISSDSWLIEFKGKNYIGTISDDVISTLREVVDNRIALNQLNTAEREVNKTVGRYRSPSVYVPFYQKPEIDTLIAHIGNRKQELETIAKSFSTKLYVRGY
jgi:hypothetical protein